MLMTSSMISDLADAHRRELYATAARDRRRGARPQWRAHFARAAARASGRSPLHGSAFMLRAGIR